MLFVCRAPPRHPHPPALRLCYPMWRWCHSWGEAMIKILLSPPRRGLPSLHDSSPPVRARRSAAAHLSSCLGGAGGSRALPLKPRYLTFVFGRGNKRGSSRLSARIRGRLMKAVNTQTWSLRWSDLITQTREFIRRIRDLITASDSNQWTQTNLKAAALQVPPHLQDVLQQPLRSFVM